MFDKTIGVISNGINPTIFYWLNEENIKIGAYKVNVVDPTGAGDVFGGAFISTLAQGGTS